MATFTFGDASRSINNPTSTSSAAPSKTTFTFGDAAKGVALTTPPEKERGAFGKVANFLAPTATQSFEKLQRGETLSARDVIGSALEIGSFAIPAATGARVLGLGAKGTALTLGKRIGAGAITGAATGATSQAGTAIGEGADAGEVVKRAAGGAVIGGALGGAVPIAQRVATGTFGKARNIAVSHATEKAEQAALLKKGVPDSRIATKTLEKGKVVTDKAAKEAVRQGIPEADVALIKTSSNLDKKKMAKMLDIRQSQTTNKRITARATDVVGDTFLERVAKPIQKLNRDAGKKLDQVANRLAGKKIDPTNAVSEFANQLDTLRIKPDPRTGKLTPKSFKDSAFEGISSVQRDITNVWNRALRVAKSKDALQAHNAKTFIDQVVEYGAEGKGLKGKASTLLKKFRHNLDTELDTKFAAYNKVNTQFADTVNELNRIGAAMGKTFRIGDDFADARAGLVMRRILSNTKSRADVLQLLESSQGVLKKYGIKLDEDVIAQANFADTLEKVLGSEAPTSFLGQIEKGLEQAGSATSELLRGDLIRGGIKAGVDISRAARGVNQENLIKALRELLKVKPKAFTPKK